MNDFAAVRRNAWTLLWSGRWLWRLLVAALLLGMCGNMVVNTLRNVLVQLGVQDWFSYLTEAAFVRFGTEGSRTLPALTPDFIDRATTSTCLLLFFMGLMGGIAAYGGAAVLLRCVRDRHEDWLKAAFSGFRYPFSLLGVFLLEKTVYAAAFLTACLTGSLIAVFALPVLRAQSGLALIAGCLSLQVIGLLLLFAAMSVPFYRFRFVWLLKADHPDWGPLRCFRECAVLMNGHKRQSFRLDVSYWKAFVWSSLPIFCAVPGVLAVVRSERPLETIARQEPLFALLFLAFCAAFFVVTRYIAAGQGLFYSELEKGRSTVEGR